MYRLPPFLFAPALFAAALAATPAAAAPVPPLVQANPEATAAEEAWIRVGVGGQDQVIWVLASLIEPSKDNPAWMSLPVRYEMARPTESRKKDPPGPAYQSLLILWEFDCPARKVRLNGSMEYGGPELTGTRTHAPLHSIWTATTPNSTGDVLMKIVCDRYRPASAT